MSMFSSKKQKIDNNLDDTIIELAIDQRQPKGDEPKCIICGRYGEYICDTYDVDICSKECKQLYSSKKNSNSKVLFDQLKQYPIVRFPENSSAQRPALPGEEKCLLCKKFGTKQVFGSAKLCSKDCLEDFLKDNDRLLKYPPITFSSRLYHQSTDRRKELQITVSSNSPPLIEKFSDINLDADLFKNIEKNRLCSITPFQSQASAIIAEGSDLVGCGEKGTGKTMAYLIPLINRVITWRTEFQDKVLALIVTATRETATQLEQKCKRLCEGIPNMRTALIIGGISETTQQYRLKSAIQIIIATPGRLLKLNPDLRQCLMVVLHDGFTLLDGTFMEETKSVLRLLPPRHQTIIMCPTLIPSLEEHAQQVLFFPVRLIVGGRYRTAALLRQIVIWVENNNKKKRLLSLCNDARLFVPPAIVYVEGRLGGLCLADYLLSKGILCTVIHAQTTPEQEELLLDEFFAGKYTIVIATWQIRSGISSLPFVSQVIFFDLPPTVHEFVNLASRAFISQGEVLPCANFHRVKQHHVAYVFINNSDRAIFADFYDYCVSNDIQIPIQLAHSKHLAFEKQNRKINASRSVR